MELRTGYHLRGDPAYGPGLLLRRCIRAEASYTGSEDLTRRRRSCPVPLQDPLENQYSLRKGGPSTLDLRDVHWRCLHPFGRKGVAGGPLHGGFGAWVGLWKKATLRTTATRSGIRHRLQEPDYFSESLTTNEGGGGVLEEQRQRRHQDNNSSTKKPTTSEAANNSQ